MSNFYQKRATLDDMPQSNNTPSVASSNIFRSYEEAVKYSSVYEVDETQGDDATAQRDDRIAQNALDDEDDSPDMSFTSVLQKRLIERKTSTPPKIPQMPGIGGGTVPGAPEIHSHIATKGFPQVLRNVNLGRAKEVTEDALDSQRRSHQKILQENLALQRDMERRAREKTRSAVDISAVAMDEEVPQSSVGLLPQRAESLEQTKESVHKENLDKFQKMDPEEIERLRKELIGKLDPSIVKKLQERASKSQSITNQSQRPLHTNYTEEEKLEWTKDVDPNEHTQSNETRYDMEGRPVVQEPEEYDRVLYHHGVDQHKAGYTLSEICYLCRSSVPGQKIINLNLLSKIIRHQLTTQPQEYFSDMFYSLMDDFQLPMILVFALKEKNVNVLHAALDALLAFIHFEHNERWLEAFERHTLTSFVQSPMMTPISQPNEDEVVEQGVPKMKNITGTAKHDLLKAFMDMGLLEILYRICSQLDDYASTSQDIPLFITRVLRTLVMHSPSTSYAVQEHVLLKNASSSGGVTVLSVLLAKCPEDALKLVHYMLRYSVNDSKSVLKGHASIVNDAQVSLAAFSAGNWSKIALYEQQNHVLRLLIGQGDLLIPFCADNFQYILQLLRLVFNANATVQQLNLVASQFDLLEAYCRANPTDQICHLRIFTEADCVLMMRHLYKLLEEDSEEESSSLHLTRQHLFARMTHFYASFYSSIVHCTAHQQHTMDSIQRVQRSFTTKEDGQSLLDILHSQFSTTFSSLNCALPNNFTKFEYPQNLSMYPINLTPDITQFIQLDLITSVLRLNFYLVQGFPPMKKYIVDGWLVNQLPAMKAQLVTCVKQRATMYEDNQFIMKYANVGLSDFGSLVLDSHFLLNGSADDSCKTHPDEELNFFLFLGFASTSLNVYHECVKRVCHMSYPKVEEAALKAADNTADWFFNALEHEYLRHGVEKVDIASLTQTVSLLNIFELHAAEYLDTFISPLIRLANVMKVLLSCGEILHEDAALRDALNEYVDRFYEQHFESHDAQRSLKRFVTDDSQEYLSKLSEELLNVYINSSYNHPTFAAYLCLFLDSAWPVNIQKQVLKQVDLFRNVHLDERIGQHFTRVTKFPNDTKFDAQFVDYVLHEFTGLVGCSDRSDPLYVYFTKRLASMMQLSTFYKEQYREELEEYSRLMRDLGLSHDEE